MSIASEIAQLGRQAREAARSLSQLSAAQKNTILLAMADGLLAAQDAILEANAKDLASGEEKGLTKAMLDRLLLNPTRLAAMAQGVREVAELPDPVGEILQSWERPNGLKMEKVRTPIGVIAIIFESRPNVTSDAAVLCFKSGNATILRGGSEAFHSNTAIAAALQRSGEAAGLPAHSIQLVANTSRDSVQHLAELDRYVDLIIPRGGKGLIETVVKLARMPVIKHYDGICHLFVDAAADLEMACQLVINGKTQKPGVCNALETLLVSQAVAAEFLPKVGAALEAKNCQMRADTASRAFLPTSAQAATEQDWGTEHLDLILNIKTVANTAEALEHIAQYGSRHSDCIVTRDTAAAEAFLNAVDSSVVFWNASTRFNDGGEFGFGCEIGISTDKLHARGPMALPELTIYKYKVRGTGQVRG